MKILVVHNHYREPGGEDESVRAEIGLLEAHGHEVVRFFLRNLEAREGPLAAVRGVWSRECHATLRRLVRRERPHVAHFHNTFHRVSPSAYWAVASEGVPIVQTLHNYRLVCCSAQLFRGNRPCQECVGKMLPWPGIVHACYRGSVPASVAVTATTTLHRVLGTWRNLIDVYVALSESSRSKFLGGGVPEAKIVVKPNAVHPDPGVGPGDGDFALFAGRLTAEKGVDSLLAAWERIGAEIPLRIVGDGPLADRVSQLATRSQIEWLGWRPFEEVLELMGKARCVVVPSEWYEPFARVVVESFAKGTPAVVSDAGAPAELVNDGRTGFHFRSGDSEDMARVLRRVFAPDSDLAAMRRAARREYEAKYTGAVNHELMMAIYARAIGARRGDGKG